MCGDKTNMVASVFLLWLYNKMLDKSRRRWVIQETHNERKKLLGLFEYGKERTITTELVSVALKGGGW